MLGRARSALATVACAAALGGCGGGTDERSAGNVTTAEASGWPTWVLDRPGEVRVAGPSADAGRASAEPAGGDPFVPWIERALRSVARHTKNPPAASRAYALVSVAAYDAAVAAAHWQQEHGDAHPSIPAAIAGAASRTLAHAFPEEPAAGLDLDAQAAAETEVEAGRATSEAVTAGLELGREVAERAIDRVRGDRPNRHWHGKVPRGKGRWEPPPGSVARPTAPLAARWYTWVLEEPDALRPSPPPEYGSDEYLAATREVLDVARDLTEEQRAIAEFWAGGDATALPPGIWNQGALEAARQRRLGPLETVRMFAALNVAMADAGVATWDAKYAYWTARPVNVIPELGLAEAFEPVLPTPLFPSYPSGHATYSSAAGEVMAGLFPDQAEVFRARAREAVMSRLYGGVHFRFDNDAGAEVGREIGRRVLRRMGESPAP